MTRDTYAKELIRAAEAAFRRNETPQCPHQDCGERLSVVRQSTFSTRSLFCPVHGHIFQEQEETPFGKLDWEGAAQRIEAAYSEYEEEDHSESEFPGRDKEKHDH
ncbi:MAG TPA: hypothetical protein VMX94_07940 [Armatimonadota bacterium]|nr:hypothetical protein [Armatimonadota bacterium]